MTPHFAPAAGAGPRHGPARVLDFIASTWFGMTMLALIFVYSSIGSAVPPIRQGALADWLGLEFLRFDKSEMEWFSWWPFQVQIALFCLSLVVATIRRVPLSLASAGIWVTHAGILLMAAASAYYFGTKLEGDAVVFQSRALILAAGMTAPVPMVVRPQAKTTVQSPGDKPYAVSVAQIVPGYEIPTGTHQGEKTQAVWFNVEHGDLQFTRIVLVGYPEYTEDVFAGGSGGMQRASSLTGHPLLDKTLQIVLDYDPALYFYHSHQPPVHSTGAVYARFAPTNEWTQLRFGGLPHYYERLGHRSELWTIPGQALPAERPLDLRAQLPPDAGVIAALDVRITDYLPYANLESRWVEGGSALNPVARFRVTAGHEGSEHELLALSPTQRTERLPDGAQAEFAWAATPEERDHWLTPPHPRVVFRLESQQLERTLDLAAIYRSGAAIEGTDYRLEVRKLFPEGLMGGEGSPALGLFRVRKGTTSFDRLVIAGDQSGGREVDTEFKGVEKPVDPDVKLQYLDPSPERLLIVGYPDSPAADLVLTRRDGSYWHQQLQPGATATLGETTVQLDALISNAREDTRPVIVPRGQRRSLQEVGKNTSLVRVEVRDATGVVSAWLPFNEYAFYDEQRAQPGRFRYHPRKLRLADGRDLWLLYSRWRDPLPAPVALDRFVLQTYPGGDRPSDYISVVCFGGKGNWSRLHEVKSNCPVQHGHLWYFQSQWDPDSEAHTVLGVGNRNGVHAMMAGVCLSIAGMIWTFYVKPVLRRRSANGTKVTATGAALEVTHA